LDCETIKGPAAFTGRLWARAGLDAGWACALSDTIIPPFPGDLEAQDKRLD
jgi:hypothetical protein